MNTPRLLALAALLTATVALAAPQLEQAGVAHVKVGQKLMLQADGKRYAEGTEITVIDTQDRSVARKARVVQMLGGNKSVMVEILE